MLFLFFYKQFKWPFVLETKAIFWFVRAVVFRPFRHLLLPDLDQEEVHLHRDVVLMRYTWHLREAEALRDEPRREYAIISFLLDSGLLKYPCCLVKLAWTRLVSHADQSRENTRRLDKRFQPSPVLVIMWCLLISSVVRETFNHMRAENDRFQTIHVPCEQQCCIMVLE